MKIRSILAVLLMLTSTVFGATKISELPEASSLTGEEIIPIVQSETTKRTTAEDVAASGAPKAHTQAMSTITDAGDAATKNVGTGAGTVCAGDDSRLSDTRTPIAHAASHTDGTDDIQSATNIQKGLATAAQITALEAATLNTDSSLAGNSYFLDEDNMASNDATKAASQQSIKAYIDGKGFSTGDVKLTLKAVADTGWVMMDDGSIGSAASGATTRANADTEALYTLLWNNVIDTWCPVAGGRGGSAAADFAANKTLTLPRALGRALAVSGDGASLTSRALGEYLGEEAHALSAAENGPHTHGLTNPAAPFSSASSGGGSTPFAGGTAYPGITATDSSGSGTAHNTMQPSSFFNIMVKL